MAVATVLLVEPNDHLRTVFRRLFARAGIDLVEAVDGEAALGAAHHGVPDLIVVEGSVRDASGQGLLTRLEHDPDLRAVPVIVLAARARGLDRVADVLDAAVEAGALGPGTIPERAYDGTDPPHLQELQHPFRPRRLIELAQGTLNASYPQGPSSA